MSSKIKVVKNSLFLVVQQLILNTISIFAVGYIARKLGQDNYGKFIFAFSFIAIFSPLTNLGIGPITTREIAENLRLSGTIAGKIIVFRTLLSIATFFIAAISINIMEYPQETRLVVYIASINFISTSITGTIYSLLQAHERVDLTASTMFISGLVLTLFSVITLFFGFGLKGITIAYVGGNILAMIIGFFFVYRQSIRIKFSFDKNYIKYLLFNGKDFFIPDVLNIFGNKIGIILLSKLSGDMSVGTYGAAITLVEKLIIIPDSLCTSLYPVLIKTFQSSEEKFVSLIETFYKYLLIMGLPIAIGINGTSNSVVKIIYGEKYMDAAANLSFLAWWLFLNFLNYLQVYIISAMHKEKKFLSTNCVSNITYLLAGCFLIYGYKDVGASIAILILEICKFVINLYHIKKAIKTKIVSIDTLIKATISGLVLWTIIMFIKQWNVFIVILISITVYLVIIQLVKLISFQEIIFVLKNIVKK